MRGPGGGGEEIRSRVSRYVRYNTYSCVESRVGTYVRSPRLHTTYYYLTSFSSRSFSCGAFALGRHFPALPSRPIHPLPLLCFRPNPPHHRLNNRHNMSAIFNFSSLLTVLLLVICTCAYLRDLRPTIFDSGQVRTENKPLQTNTGERNYSIINNLTFLSAPFLETDSSTG